MDNKKVIDNYNYGILVYEKYTAYDNLNLTIDKYEEEFSLPLEMLLSLYIIDYNNADEELFEEKELAAIKHLADELDKNASSIITITSPSLKKILSSCKEKRVSQEINKQICLKLAEINNKKYKDNIAHTIHIDKLEKTLNNIK